MSDTNNGAHKMFQTVHVDRILLPCKFPTVLLIYCCSETAFHNPGEDVTSTSKIPQPTGTEQIFKNCLIKMVRNF